MQTHASIFNVEINYELDMQLGVNDLDDRVQDRFFCILLMNSILFRLSRLLLDDLCTSILLECF